MTKIGASGEEVGEQARDAARRASPWVRIVARVGYVAKGVVYAVIGFLALRKAMGVGGETTGPQSAMRSVGSQPFGGIIRAIPAAWAQRSKPSSTGPSAPTCSS